MNGLRKASPAPVSTASDTRDKILESAELLFARHGYRGVSVRMIASAAGVNWSLLRYHFTGKEGLLAEIYRRHCSVMNAERLRLLAEAQERSSPAKLEDVIEAFIRPALAVTHDDKAQSSFSRLRTILAAEDSVLLEHLVADNFDFSSTTFIKALSSCLPGLPYDQVLWRFHFMLGTVYYSASGPHRIKTFSQGRCDPNDLEANIRHIVPFLAAAFRAEPTKKAKRLKQ